MAAIVKKSPVFRLWKSGNPRHQPVWLAGCADRRDDRILAGIQLDRWLVALFRRNGSVNNQHHHWAFHRVLQSHYGRVRAAGICQSVHHAVPDASRGVRCKMVFGAARVSNQSINGSEVTFGVDHSVDGWQVSLGKDDRNRSKRNTTCERLQLDKVEKHRRR